mgnify:FL=1|jgi:uncharacterized protein (UPF0332 family)
MLSKKELKKIFDELSHNFQIRIEKNEIKFYKSYLDKAFHNLEVAGILNILSNEPNKKEHLDIKSDEYYFDWIIISSYYAMYMAATSALAKLGFKATTHGATVTGLEYKYCIDKKLLPRRYIDMIENANFGREDVHKLDDAMKRRIAVQYTVTKKYGQKESKHILNDAKEFVNKISDIISE